MFRPLFLATALLAATAPTPAPRVERTVLAMGTRAKISVAAPDRATAFAAAEGAVRALERADRRLSTWGEAGELLDFAARLSRGPVRLDGLLHEELAAAWRCAARTDGAFDPTVGPLVEAWGLRAGGRRPDPAALALALEATGFDRVTSDDDGLWRSAGPVRFEEGGFGKGAGADRAIAAARAAGAGTVRIDLGGQLAFSGVAEWVGIAHPRSRDREIARIRVDGGSVATSGNSERGVRIDGRRVGHLLDPRTGRPAPEIGSVTILAPSGLEADCLSTGLYVLGPERALELAESWPDVEAVVARPGAEGAELSWTSGLDGRIEVLTPPTRRAPSTASSRGGSQKNENHPTGR